MQSVNGSSNPWVEPATDDVDSTAFEVQPTMSTHTSSRDSQTSAPMRLQQAIDKPIDHGLQFSDELTIPLSDPTDVCHDRRMNRPSDRDERQPIASLVVPAHNEARSITRLLDHLFSDIDLGDLEVIVVCNGCSDDTAARANAFDSVKVVETPIPSKFRAMALGDEVASYYPRVFVDADIEISGQSIRRMAQTLTSAPHLKAVAPSRKLDLSRSGPLVRAYYRVWQKLPQVDDGLYARGVIAVAATGMSAFRQLPETMSDDLVLSDAFAEDETEVVGDAHSYIRAPRHVSDLVRRRIRVATGNRQADDLGLRRPSSKTQLTQVLRIARTGPTDATSVAIFLAITSIARLRAALMVRRGDFGTWLRDESSRG